MEQGRTIRLPVGVQAQLHDIEQLRHALPEGEELPIERIAEHFQVSQQRAQELLDLTCQAIHSLDAACYGQEHDLELEHATSAQQPSPEAQVETQNLREQLFCLLHTLDERERTILILRFGLSGEQPRTLEQCSTILGITRERVRQLEVRAIPKLRAMAEARQLHDYLRA